MEEAQQEQKFNFIDFLQTSGQREYQSSLLDSSIEMQGRLCYIFLLDKKATELDPVYGVEKYRRVYLPHFMQRAMYKTNVWNGELNLNVYEETEDKIEFVFTFDRMVHNIRALKDKNSGVFTITNTTKNSVVFSVEDKKYTLKFDDNTILEEELGTYSTGRTIKDFVKKINGKVHNVEFAYEGNNEDVSLLKTNAPLLIRKGKQYKKEIKDNTYQNCSDVIENGAVIMSDRYRLYEAINVKPSNDNYGGYISWVCSGQLIDMSVADSLPNDYRMIVQKNRYNLPKNKME